MENTMISQSIRHYRRMAKLSQEELADRVDVSETYIRKLEAGGPLSVLRHGNQTVAGTEHYARSLAPIQQRIGTEQKLRGTGSPQRLHADRIHYPV